MRKLIIISVFSLTLAACGGGGGSSSSSGGGSGSGSGSDSPQIGTSQVGVQTPESVSSMPQQ